MSKSKNIDPSARTIGFLLLFVVAFIPLVCYFTQVPVRSDEVTVIRTGTAYNDFFSYTKSILIMISGVAIAAFLVFEIWGNNSLYIDFKSVPIILIGLYGILAFISTLLSGHLSVAFLGATERYEGLFVILCYIIFFIAAIAYSCDEKRSKFLLYGFMASGLILGFIGLLQIFDVPVFDNSFMSALLGGGLLEEGATLRVKFDSVFATLYNPNCAGLYFGMMATFFVVLSVFMPMNKPKILSIAAAVLTLLSAIGTDSVGGFLGLGCGIIFAVVIAIVYFIFKKKSKVATIASIVSVVVLVIASVVFLNSNAMTAQKIRIITDAVLSGQGLAESSNFYKDITIDGNTGNIHTANGIYSIVADGESSKFYHDDIEMTISNTEAATNEGGVHNTYNDGNITWEVYLYQTESLFNISIIANDNSQNEKYFMFGQTEEGLTFLDKAGNPVDISVPVDSIGFEGIERLGSNRGYIWSRSLPLVFSNLIIGAGPDCFEFEFPQNDVIGKVQFLNNPYIIIDKPHNMFLQHCINTGTLSCILLIVLFVGYIINTIKSIFNEDNKYLLALKFAISSAVIAYLAAAMTTDSVVSVAPVFWVLLGMGIGINFIGKVKSKEERELEKIKRKLK